MYNYKFFIRSILVITFLLLIISPGCTLWTKANYKESGREGFDELKKIEEAPEKYQYDLDIESKTKTDYNTELFSIIEEHYIKANRTFSKMKEHATTNDEKELASSLIKYTYYNGLRVPKLRDLLIYLSKNNVSDENAYLHPEALMLARDIKSYQNSANLELEKAKEILGRMPEYQKDFAYLYELESIFELETGQDKKDKPSPIQETNANIISDEIFVYLLSAFIIIIFIIIPSGIAYYLVRKKSNREEKFLNSALMGVGFFIICIGMLLIFSSGMNISFLTGGIIILLFGILLLILYILYYKDIPLNLKKRNKSNAKTNDSKLEINLDKKDKSLEYLKSFDKLTEKEIVVFLYLKNNQNISKDKLNEMFGEEIINSLIAKGHFTEENVDQD